jgi:hypothetical protein
MGAGALSRLPEGVPDEAIFTEDQVAAFLAEDFDLDRFLLVATLAEDGETRQVTMRQLLAEIKSINSGTVVDDWGQGSSEAKDGSRPDTGDGKVAFDDEGGSYSRPGTGAASSRPDSTGSGIGSRPTTATSIDPKSRKGRKARRRARERAEKNAAENDDGGGVILTKHAALYVSEMREKVNRLRLMQRVKYSRELKQANDAKKKQDEEERLERIEAEIESNKEEAAANAYMVKLSEKRKALGWGNWDKMKTEEAEEEEEEEAVEEEEPPEVKEKESEEEKAAKAAVLEKEEADIAELHEEVKILRSKLETELKGEIYKPPAESEALSFLHEHYRILALTDKFPEQVAASYALDCMLTLDPDSGDYARGRDESVAMLLKALGNCSLRFHVLKVEVARRSKKGYDLSFTAIVHMGIDNDAPRVVMEVFDLVSSKEAALPGILVAGRQSVIVRDNRPLYTFAYKAPAKTRHDNLEPHIRAMFPISEAEMAERAAEWLEGDRRKMGFNDDESRAFEKHRDEVAAKAAKEAAAAAEKARIAALFKDDDEEEEEEEEEEVEDEAENEAAAGDAAPKDEDD